VYFVHPLLRRDVVEAREYQLRLAKAASEHSCLVVLPTGLGKTVIALLNMAHHLEQAPDKKVLVLAPTKPLVEQHAKAFRRLLDDVPVACFTGETAPSSRDKQWQESRVIVATPQIVENDIVRGIRTLADVGLIVYDEAHRATGNYAYVFIARRHREAGGTHAMGLTASPGNDIARIQTILSNLGLQRIEVRSEADPDVAPYVHEVAVQYVKVKPTASLVRVVQLLNRAYLRCVAQLRRLGYLHGVHATPGRKDLLDLGHQLRMEAGARNARRGVFEGVTTQARALKIQHALELAETQGLTVLHRFLARVQAEAEQSGGSRAARDFVKDPEFAEALGAARESPEPHPKVAKVVELVQQQFKAGARRILVFANYRETADLIVAGLAGLEGCRSHKFVGHARASGEVGLTKKGQQRVLDQFRSGELNVLVSTSVAEEGLDVPDTDAVILYEPVPSGIRMIQRRGRTGRSDEGRVIVLLTEGTRDERYYWSALRHEKRMHEELAFLRQAASRQTVLAAASHEPKPAPPRTAVASEMLVDARESNGPIPRILLDRGVRVKVQTLMVGDYAPSPRVLVERKSVADFCASIRDGRLFDQARDLANADQPVLVIEGDLHQNMPPSQAASVMGCVASLIADFGIAVVNVPDAGATAELLMALGRREQQDGARASVMRFQKRQPSAQDELRFILEGIAGVGPVVALRLLDRFGSILGVTNATVAELQSVEGIGSERARTIHEVLRRTPQPSVLTDLAAAPVAVAALEGGDGAAR
jgi:ERCC4-related helicase